MAPTDHEKVKEFLDNAPERTVILPGRPPTVLLDRWEAGERLIIASDAEESDDINMTVNGRPGNRAGACKWARKYPNQPRSTLRDAKFCADSKSAIRIVRATRNLEIRAQAGSLGRRARIGIPTEPNQYSKLL